jgi:hypothetical protein
MQKLKLFLCVVVLTSIFGCAHPISVVPKGDAIVRSVESQEKLKKKVGFYISAEALNLEVTTPGGGGDNVRYFPYRDMEAGYQKMLTNVFDDVVRVAKVDDLSEFQRGGLSYVFIPEMVTSSGSTGFFTWPPTNFTVDLTSKIRDVAGKLVSSPRVIGVGSFPDGAIAMKGNFGITGQLAMQDALLKTQAALFEALSASRAPSIVNAPFANSRSIGLSAESRLLQLKDLLDKKLIDTSEYEKKKTEILNSL